MARSVYRRLVKIGNSVYVSVPRGWIESRGLGPGSVLAIESVEGGLLLKPAERASGEVRVKRLAGGGESDIIKAYLAGYEVIEIENPSAKLKEALERLLNLLVGLEVVEEKRDGLVLQCFISEGYDVRGVLSRMDAISRGMYVDAATALEAGDRETLEAVRSREHKLDRLYFLAVRLIRSAIQSPELSGQERLFLIDARLFTKLLEEIGDEAERMTYLQPVPGLFEVARAIADRQGETVDAFLRRSTRRGATIDDLKSWSSKLERSPASEALLKIAKLVMDLTELV